MPTKPFLPSGAQNKVLDLLVRGARPHEAAERTQTHPSTISRWLNDPDFIRVLEERRQAVCGGALKRLDLVAVEAIEVLAEIMRDAGNSASSRVRAAAELLDRATWVPRGKGQAEAIARASEQYSAPTVEDGEAAALRLLRMRGGDVGA